MRVAQPFLILGLLVLVVYALLSFCNYRLWRNDRQDVFQQAKPDLIKQARETRVQVDPGFLGRAGIFATRSRHEELQARIALQIKQECAWFAASTCPPPPTSSTWARTLHSALARCRYRTGRADPVCARVAVIDSPDPSSREPCMSAPAAERVFLLRHGGHAAHLPPDAHVFSQDLRGPNGLFLDVPDVFDRRNLVNLNTFNPSVYLQVQSHASDVIETELSEACHSNSDYHSVCFISQDLHDISRNRSLFVFINHTEPFKWNRALYETLKAGAIPVIAGLSFDALPLSDMIDWSESAVRVAPRQTHRLVEVVRQLDPDQVRRLARRTRFLFEHHFCDADAVVRLVLSAVRYRVRVKAPDEPGRVSTSLFTRIPDGYKVGETVDDVRHQSRLQNQHYAFNRNPTHLDRFSPWDRLWEAGAAPRRTARPPPNADYARRLMAADAGAQFTIVLNAYRRDDQLRLVLRRLDGVRFCRAVLVVWCDVERTPSAPDWPLISVPVHFVRAANNSLNQRFLPLDLIRTEAVFSMDDDFQVDAQYIEFMFRVWLANRDVIVGPVSRLATHDPDTDQFEYRFADHCTYNLILTSGAFLHRSYLTAYWDDGLAEVRRKVDSLMNCEDLAINFLVAHLSGKAAVKATGIEITSGSFEKAGKLSSRASHYEQRRECIRWLTHFFGYFPLISSEVRADSVHFGHSPQLQCFRQA